MQWELTLYSLHCTATILLTLYHYDKDNSLILEQQNVEEPQGHDSIAYVRLFEALQVEFSDVSAEERAKMPPMPPVEKILDPSIFKGPKRLEKPVDQKILSQLVQQCHNASKKDFVFSAPRPSAADAASVASAASEAPAVSAATTDAEAPASAAAPEYRMIGEAINAIEGIRELFLRYTFSEDDAAAAVMALLEASKRPDLPTTQRAMASALLDAMVVTAEEQRREDSATGTVAVDALSPPVETTTVIDQSQSQSQPTAAATVDRSKGGGKPQRPRKLDPIPGFESFPLFTREVAATVDPEEKFPTMTGEDLKKYLGEKLVSLQGSDGDKEAEEEAEKAVEEEAAAEGQLLQEQLLLPRHICDALRPDHAVHMKLLGDSLVMLTETPAATTAAEGLDLVSLGGLVACLVRFAVAWSRSDSTVTLDKRIGGCLKGYWDKVNLYSYDGEGEDVHSRLGKGNTRQLRQLVDSFE